MLNRGLQPVFGPAGLQVPGTLDKEAATAAGGSRMAVLSLQHTWRPCCNTLGGLVRNMLTGPYTGLPRPAAGTWAANKFIRRTRSKVTVTAHGPRLERDDLHRLARRRGGRAATAGYWPDAVLLLFRVLLLKKCSRCLGCSC